MSSLSRPSSVNQRIIRPPFIIMESKCVNWCISYAYLQNWCLIADATVVVGDVSDEASILNAAFLNKKVMQKIAWYWIFMMTSVILKCVLCIWKKVTYGLIHSHFWIVHYLSQWFVDWCSYQLSCFQIWNQIWLLQNRLSG